MRLAIGENKVHEIAYFIMLFDTPEQVETDPKLMATEDY